jgi:hypothetical protein
MNFLEYFSGRNSGLSCANTVYSPFYDARISFRCLERILTERISGAQTNDVKEGSSKRKVVQK